MLNVIDLSWVLPEPLSEITRWEDISHGFLNYNRYYSDINFPMSKWIFHLLIYSKSNVFYITIAISFIDIRSPWHGSIHSFDSLYSYNIHFKKHSGCCIREKVIKRWAKYFPSIFRADIFDQCLTAGILTSAACSIILVKGIMLINDIYVHRSVFFVVVFSFLSLIIISYH